MLLLSRLEKPGDTTVPAGCRSLVSPESVAGSTYTLATRAKRQIASGGYRPFRFRPLLIDAYVLERLLVLFRRAARLACLALIEVFTFFELLGDMVKNDIEHVHHARLPVGIWRRSLIYQLTPIGTLVASLICFGILTKYNEVTAFKAGGVSVHRLAAPVWS